MVVAAFLYVVGTAIFSNMVPIGGLQAVKIMVVYICPGIVGRLVTAWLLGEVGSDDNGQAQVDRTMHISPPLRDGFGDRMKEGFKIRRQRRVSTEVGDEQFELGELVTRGSDWESDMGGRLNP